MHFYDLPLFAGRQPVYWLSHLDSVFDSPDEANCRNAADVEFGIASEPVEVLDALQLVYQAYRRSGLVSCNRSRARVTPYHLLPTTEILVGLYGKRCLCTTSLVRDGELGLPMELIYGSEVEALRAEGLRCAEVSCLADRCGSNGGSFQTVFRLMSLTAQVATKRELDALLVVVHPKHAPFYERFLGFRRIGPERFYPMVRNNPAVPLVTYLNRLPFDYPQVCQRLFTELFPEEVLEPRSLSGELLKELHSMLWNLPRRASTVSSLSSGLPHGSSGRPWDGYASHPLGTRAARGPLGARTSGHRFV